MNVRSNRLKVAPFRPLPLPNSTRPVSLAWIAGGAPGVTRSTVSPMAYPALSAVSTSSATSYGASGSSPSVSAITGLPVSAVAPVGLNASPGGPFPPTTLPFSPTTNTV